MRFEAETQPTGTLGLRVVRSDDPSHTPQHVNPETGLPGVGPGTELSLDEILFYANPRKGLPDEVNEWRRQNSPHIARGLLHQGRARKIAQKHHLPYFWSQLFLAKIRPDGTRVELGLAGIRVVTTAGVNFLVDAFQGIVEPEILRFHGIGTGSTAEAVGDTALVTELTTQYNPDNTRATGTLTEGAGANIFRTVGTNPVDAAVGIQEHGIFSQAATGGGTLWDRTVFAVVNLGNGDSLESTYDLTISAGG